MKFNRLGENLVKYQKVGSALLGTIVKPLPNEEPCDQSRHGKLR
jgi:hypothetical protein